VVAGWLEDEGGERIGRVRSGDAVRVVFRIEASEDTEGCILGVSVRDEHGNQLYSNDTKLLELPVPTLRRGRPTEVHVSFVAALRNGNYSVMAGLVDAGLSMFYDAAEILRFVVHGSSCRHGLVDLQGRVDFRPGRDEIEPTDEPQELRHKGEAR
jgi:hypothetical protein